MKYQFIESRRSEFTVKKMNQVFKVYFSYYQHWNTGVLISDLFSHSFHSSIIILERFSKSSISDLSIV